MVALPFRDVTLKVHLGVARKKKPNLCRIGFWSSGGTLQSPLTVLPNEIIVIGQLAF